MVGFALRLPLRSEILLRSSDMVYQRRGLGARQRQMKREKAAQGSVSVAGPNCEEAGGDGAFGGELYVSGQCCASCSSVVCHAKWLRRLPSAAVCPSQRPEFLPATPNPADRPANRRGANVLQQHISSYSIYSSNKKTLYYTR